jgi:hypothetical protein
MIVDGYGASGKYDELARLASVRQRYCKRGDYLNVINIDLSVADEKKKIRDMRGVSMHEVELVWFAMVRAINLAIGL